ncbi:hypothetical protein MUK42_37045 [Musa troglodytarum]|uniref:Uncharacterized protein n=1 Tax=Musa troglodytarum TaxID=320322 RepID=A0A9E7J9P2_9LILI|nr:hypothetical protein MUK42_37045 [Musa troglodytarum]
MLLMRLMVPPQQLEECRSQIEILRKGTPRSKKGLVDSSFFLPSWSSFLFLLRNGFTFAEISLQLEKAAADRPAPGTPSPPATDSRVGSLAAGQQMQSAGLQGGAKNGEEAQDGDRCRGEDDA